jgi:hypothetical protein
MYKVSDAGVLKEIETWHLVLPLHDNDKKPFPTETIDGVVAEITGTFPGLTAVNASGRWTQDGQVYSDSSLLIIVDALPTDRAASQSFFEGLKVRLAQDLKQSKIYVTLHSSRSELLTIDEFLKEMGVEVDEIITDKPTLARKLASSIDAVRIRMGYETLLLRRLEESKQIRWERRFCGVHLVSVFEDHFPAGTRLLAADRVSDYVHFFAGNHSDAYAVVGDYEFQRYLVQETSFRPLVPAVLPPDINDRFTSPGGVSLTAKRFVEEFTGAVAVGYIALREEGFLPGEITVSVGSDGSLQHAKHATGKGAALVISPATIPNEVIQREIIRCAGVACNGYEAGSLDLIALAQAKAMHRSVLKRAAARFSMAKATAQ